jgi:DNA-binding NtrC family response regulator
VSFPTVPFPRSALVVAGPEESRVLLRGLLRLHRLRVTGEVEGMTAALERLSADLPPDVLVVDDQLAEGEVVRLIPEVLRRFPAMRVVLVTHDGAPDPPPGPAAPVVRLHRPFRVQEFAAAISPMAVRSSPRTAESG